MSLSLPLLPAANFEAGLALIQVAADLIANDHPRILEFLAYMRRNWVPRAQIVCSYRCLTRTNPEMENLHC